MSVNLAQKYEKKLEERFNAGSYTEPHVGHDYNWEGVNAISTWELIAADLSDYTASGTSRFGTVSEVDDVKHTYTLAKKRSFAKTFDITNVQDQLFVKQANAYLKQMWDERYVPEIDTYRFSQWAIGAGLGKLNTTALTKSTIMDAIMSAMADMDDALVPQEGRVIFLRSDMAAASKLASELAYSQNWLDKTVIKGKIAEINGCPVVSVPSSRLPAGVEFIIKYRNATADPMKLKMLRANSDAPGIAGTLMEGLCRYDAFVLDTKVNGIFVYSVSDKCGNPTAALSNGKVALTAASSGTVKYTVDGTNPKTSSTAATYSAALTVASGATVRFYEEKSGSLPSAIVEYKMA